MIKFSQCPKCPATSAAHSCYCNFHNLLTPFLLSLTTCLQFHIYFSTPLLAGQSISAILFPAFTARDTFLIIRDFSCKREYFLSAQNNLYLSLCAPDSHPIYSHRLPSFVLKAFWLFSPASFQIADSRLAWLCHNQVPRSTPLTDAITGHPIPGEPSIIASSVSGACFSIAIFTSVTSFPEFPRPIFNDRCRKDAASSRYSSFASSYILCHKPYCLL